MTYDGIKLYVCIAMGYSVLSAPVLPLGRTSIVIDREGAFRCMRCRSDALNGSDRFSALPLESHKRAVCVPGHVAHRVILATEYAECPCDACAHYSADRRREERVDVRSPCCARDVINEVSLPDGRPEYFSATLDAHGWNEKYRRGCLLACAVRQACPWVRPDTVVLACRHRGLEVDSSGRKPHQKERAWDGREERCPQACIPRVKQAVPACERVTV